MPTLTIKNAYIGQPGVTDVIIYTAPANTVARVIKCTATNEGATPTTITFHKVEKGGVVGNNRLLMNEGIIGDKETYDCPGVVGQTLNPEMFISVVAGDADMVTVSLDVAESTR